MVSLNTNYLGLELRSPIIISSGPLTQNIVSLKECERNGAGAVVLKSLFEEEIDEEVKREREKNEEYLNFSGSDREFEINVYEHLVSRYLKLLEMAKNELKIPVIVSLCCKSLSTWKMLSERFSHSGADAIELNYYPVTYLSSESSDKVDKDFELFSKSMRESIKCPLSVKIGYNYSSLCNRIKFLDKINMDGVVLFNRMQQPDVDIENKKIVFGSPLTSGNEYGNALRYVALMSGECKLDIASNTGIHSSSTIIKMLLSGSKAVEVQSVVIKNGFGVIDKMNKEISIWMEKNGYSSIDEFRGMLAQEESTDGYLWERNQFTHLIKG